MGWSWVGYRLWHGLLHRSGYLKWRMPLSAWPELDRRRGESWLRHRPPFLFPADMQQRIAARDWGDTNVSDLQAASDSLASGLWQIYGDCQGEFPPNWHRDDRGEQYDARRHWSELNEFARGDIKRLWEPARFGAAYTFARAASRSPARAAEHAERFWLLAESFHRHNPPNHGPHWKCGQEAALRLMACCFALYAFAENSQTTPARAELVIQLAEATGHRIERHVHYALSQKNNHGFSEATGLLTAGLLFPQLPSAARWAQLGRVLLQRQAAELIYEDGAFSQHSANYQRVMLQLMLWSIRLCEAHGAPLDDATIERVRRSAEFLWMIQDEPSGWLPNYGQNDGALVLPLSSCHPRDYRPVLQAAAAILGKESRYEAGAWDEETLWLTGESPRVAPRAGQPGQLSPVERIRTAELDGGAGGCHTLRSSTGMAMIRCTPAFRHRPAHADPLHVDLWWRGLNIALDPGTYSYNSPPPWNHPLAGASHHNTVIVDDLEPMERTTRFLFTPWIHGRVHCRRKSAQGELAQWEGTHDGYLRLTQTSHYRAVLRLGSEHWLVLDDLSSPAPHRYRLHWLLANVPAKWSDHVAGDENAASHAHQLDLDTPNGPYRVLWSSPGCETGKPGSLRPTMVTGETGGPRGWEAPIYGVRRPALSISWEQHAAHARFLTLFGPPTLAMQWASNEQELQVRTQRGEFAVYLSPRKASPLEPGDPPLIRGAVWRGDAGEDELGSFKMPAKVA
ncbi:MAG: alginate lyase family protein, partial [Planctomycetales bacterium]|nr:alginate lyase family protein [Planctomycetales bacterium]